MIAQSRCQTILCACSKSLRFPKNPGPMRLARPVSWPCLSVFFTIFAALPSLAQHTKVNLELTLLADVSRSITEEELERQRRCYAKALNSDEVF
ncbi:MAG: DUF1194 domain-containing protein [Sulfitobacter sp.]